MDKMDSSTTGNSMASEILKGWVLPIVSAVIIAIIINKTLFFMARIPSLSMYPTLKVGDRVFVTRVYNKGNLKRGEVVLFKSKELNTILVKRLIGLPGDTIEVKDDGVYINGVKKDEPYVKKPGGPTGAYKVPENCYFFLGDNRADSYDSRLWNTHYIPKSQIIGKAQFVLFPFSRFSILK